MVLLLLIALYSLFLLLLLSNRIPKEFLDRLHHLIEVKNKNEMKKCKKCYDEKKIDNKVYLICKECNFGFHLKCFLYWHKKYI